MWNESSNNDPKSRLVAMEVAPSDNKQHEPRKSASTSRSTFGLQLPYALVFVLDFVVLLVTLVLALYAALCCYLYVGGSLSTVVGGLAVDLRHHMPVLPSIEAPAFLSHHDRAIGSYFLALSLLYIIQIVPLPYAFVFTDRIQAALKRHPCVLRSLLMVLHTFRLCWQVYDGVTTSNALNTPLFVTQAHGIVIFLSTMVLVPLSWPFASMKQTHTVYFVCLWATLIMDVVFGGVYLMVFLQLWSNLTSLSALVVTGDLYHVHAVLVALDHTLISSITQWIMHSFYLLTSWCTLALLRWFLSEAAVSTPSKSSTFVPSTRRKALSMLLLLLCAVFADVMLIASLGVISNASIVTKLCHQCIGTPWFPSWIQNQICPHVAIDCQALEMTSPEVVTALAIQQFISFEYVAAVSVYDCVAVDPTAMMRLFPNATEWSWTNVTMADVQNHTEASDIHMLSMDAVTLEDSAWTAVIPSTVTTLHLSNMNLENATVADDLDLALQSFTCRNCGLSEVPMWLLESSRQSLEECALPANNLTDLTELLEFTHVVLLDVSQNPMLDALPTGFWTALPSLRSLNVSQTAIQVQDPLPGQQS